MWYTTFWIALATAYGVVTSQSPQAQVILSPFNNFKEVTLRGNSQLSILGSNIDKTVQFGIIEAHALFHDVTLSYNATLTSGSFATAPHVGIVIGRPGDNPTIAPVYLSQNYDEDIEVLIILQVYNISDPVPGGCNMELPMKTSPYLPTMFSEGVVVVEYPLASWPLDVKPVTCDRFPLTYDVYELYLPGKDFSQRSAFNGILLMSGVELIEQNGRKVDYYGTPPSKLRFANYDGTGRVVAVIVRGLTSSAAYVPVLSYGCHPDATDNSFNCRSLETVWSKVLCAGSLFFGLFLLLTGHRFFKTLVLFLGFIIFSTVWYFIVKSFAFWNGTAFVLSTVGIGILGALLLFIVWSVGNAPIIPLILSCLSIGALVAAAVAFSPIGDYELLKESNTLFWTSYACVAMLASILIMLSFDELPSILFSTIVGSYMFILPLDLYLGSHLKFIVLNIIRRATLAEFQTTIIYPPFETTDLVLTVVWATLILGGTIFQLWREKGRAPFPPVPSWSFLLRRPVPVSEASASVDETTPLLVSSS